MTLTTVSYAVFFALTAILYFILPKRMQNTVLLAASVLFYCVNLPGASRPLWVRVLPLCVLIGHILFTYFIARAIDRHTGKQRSRFAVFGIVVCIAVLAFFKYANYALPNLQNVIGSSIPLPLGISFYTFAVISYLIDVWRGDIAAEKNIVNWAVYVSFFATITSGPICRAQKLLPQLEKQRQFDAKRLSDALRLMLWGCFKWVAVANVLGLFVNEVFDNLGTYTGLILPIAAAGYVIQLYFEFSGYSDIARGSAMLLGIDVPVNFKSPLFSTNFSSLWSRWHITLSTWLQDYIFMPLVWSRWPSKLPVIGKRFEKPPTISSVAIVFLISGFWHGSTWCFVFWGILQAMFRVGEELMHQFYKKPVKKPKLLLRCFKTAAVFFLWSASHVFFRIGFNEGGTVGQGFAFFADSVVSGPFVQNMVNAIQNGFYTRPIMVLGYLAYITVVLCIGILADWMQIFRLKDNHITTAIALQKPAIRWVLYYGLIALVLVGFIMQSGGFGTVNFAYANF